MRLRNPAELIVLIATVGVVDACGVDSPGTPTTETMAQDIYHGTATSDYPETVIVDVLKSDKSWGRQCSGVALAPSVVLTTAHCFMGYSKFRVHVPATGQSIETTNKLVHPSYKDNDESTDADTGFDAGLLFLSEKMKLSRFPILWPSRTTESTRVRAVGRVSQGSLSPDTVYESQDRRLKLWRTNERYYEFSEPTQEKGDCGGPVVRFDVSSARHTLVGVLDAGDNTVSIATRLEPIFDWIVWQIQSYTSSHRALAPSCGSGFSCELTPVLGGLPCVAGTTLAYCCDLPHQPITDGRCGGKSATPPTDPGGGGSGSGVPPTSAPGVVMWDINGHVRNQNLAGVPGVRVQIWGYDATNHWEHYDEVTDKYGAFKLDGFIVKGGYYEVRLAPNEEKIGFGPYRYPAYTSWLWHTRDQRAKADTPLGSTAYLNQRAGADDCSGPDTTRSGSKRCDFMYTTDANPAHLHPPPPTGLRTTCDLSTPSKPKATIWWNAEPRATLGYYVRVDHRPSSFDTTACTGGAGSNGKVDPFDRCVDATTHTSLTVGPIEAGAPYYAWIQSGSVEGSFSTISSAISFHCP